MPYNPPIMTVTGRVCAAVVRSDSERGGWRVECVRHGHITTRDSIGAAEQAANDHVVERDRIGR